MLYTILNKRDEALCIHSKRKNIDLMCAELESNYFGNDKPYYRVVLLMDPHEIAECYADAWTAGNISQAVGTDLKEDFESWVQGEKFYAEGITLQDFQRKADRRQG